MGWLLAQQFLRIGNRTDYVGLPHAVDCDRNRESTARGTAMQALDNSRSNPIFLRHDLMIEMGRLQMQLDDARERSSANESQKIEPLQHKLARINAALNRLSEREEQKLEPVED